MADRPIIFSAPMVRALLDGRKTQTRRVLKPQPEPLGRFVGFSGSAETARCKVRYAPGDRLWVREAFITGYDIDDKYGRPTGDKRVWYRATDSNLTWFDPDTETTLDNPPWRPSIHMPRWASRITLTVTDVRVQRLQEISEADAVAEGIEGDDYGAWLCYASEPKGQTHWADPRESCRTLWDSIHGPGAWGANPWVSAITSTTHRCNIDQMEACTK